MDVNFKKEGNLEFNASYKQYGIELYYVKFFNDENNNYKNDLERLCDLKNVYFENILEMKKFDIKDNGRLAAFRYFMENVNITRGSFNKNRTYLSPTVYLGNRIGDKIVLSNSRSKGEGNLIKDFDENDLVVGEVKKMKR